MTAGRGVGRRVDRIYTDSSGQVRQQERHDAVTSAPQPTLRRVIVVEVFHDLATQLAGERLEQLEASVKDPTLVRRIARGCILARTITSGVDRFDDKARIFFPLFGPYIMMPIKVGEQAFVLYEDPHVSADTGLWLCRVPEPNDVDDLNYTHGDRRYASGVDRDAIDRLNNTTSPVPGFPNGDPSADSLTFGAPDEYERVIQRAIASKFFTYEAVPRFNSRPGDHVVQGSNNTLIALTTDRVSAAFDDERLTPDAGAIFMSCGRGRTQTTAVPVVVNARDQEEADKTPELRDGMSNPVEGDFDLINDSSTLMISMLTDVDENFDVDHPNGGEATQGEAAAIAMRSDRIRLLARDDVKIQAGTNGEGAAIVLRANGDILLIPGPGGVIKLGGESATQAMLTNTGASSGGNVVGQPIMSTMGGVIGTPADDPHGSFGSKVLTT